MEALILKFIQKAAKSRKQKMSLQISLFFHTWLLGKAKGPALEAAPSLLFLSYFQGT